MSDEEFLTVLIGKEKHGIRDSKGFIYYHEFAK